MINRWKVLWQAPLRLLKKANKLILTQHMHHCLKEAASNEVERDVKIEEVVGIVNKLIDK